MCYSKRGTCETRLHDLLRSLLCVIVSVYLPIHNTYAEEPVRTWVPLQGASIEGQLVRYAGGKVYILTGPDKVVSIKIGELAEDSRIYLRQHRDPLPTWETPEEAKLIAQVKQSAELTGIVQVDSPSGEVNSLGLVVKNNGSDSFVLCTSRSAFAHSELLKGEPRSPLNDQKFTITHKSRDTLRRTEARVHASLPGCLILKSPFRLAAGKEIALTDLSLTIGQPLCILDAAPNGKFDFKVGTILEINVVQPTSMAISVPRSIVTSYIVRCQERTIVQGSIALDAEGNVVGVISQPAFKLHSQPTPKSVIDQGFDYFLQPAPNLACRLEPQFIWLVATASEVANELDIAAIYIDPLDKLRRCQVLIKPFENDLRMTAAALNDGYAIRTLSGSNNVDLVSGSLAPAIREVTGDVRMARCASAKVDLAKMDGEDYMVFHAQVAYQNDKQQTRYSRVFTLNLASDPSSIKPAALERAAALNLIFD